MSKTGADLANSLPFSPHLYVSFTTNGNIFDLSGQIPLKIYVHVSRRGFQSQQHPDAHKLPIDLLANGSLLDISSAVKEGLLSLTQIDNEPPGDQGPVQSTQVLSKDLFAGETQGSTSELPHIVRLRSGLKITVIDPQCFECSFDGSISAAFKDNQTYALRYSPATEEKDWNGGFTWWKLVSDPLLPSNLSLPSDKPAVKVKKSQLPIFKALSDPPRPPRIEYELDFTPTELTVSNLEVIKIGVKFRILEATRYSVMSTRSHPGSGPKTTVLGTSEIGSFSFDIVDVDTDEVLSAAPIYGNELFSSGLFRHTFRREHLRELEPGITYTGHSGVTPRGNQDQLAAFLSYFRIKDISILQDHRLGVRLRPVQTFWSKKSIDELFKYEEAMKPDEWYIPLTIESPAVAKFTIV